MANPVFSRAEAFQPRGNPYGQPAYAGQGYRAQYGVSGQPGGESGSIRRPARTECRARDDF